MKPIPQEFIKKYVDQLLRFAQEFGVETKMGQSSLLRADHVMDLVKAFKEHEDKGR